MEKKYKMLNSFKKDSNYTYQDIARMLDCSRPFVWQVFNGSRKLSYELAIKIAYIFNTSPDDIFYSEFTNKKEMKVALKKIKNEKDKLIKTQEICLNNRKGN